MAGGGLAVRAGATIQDARTGQFEAGNGLTEQQAAFVSAYVANGGRATDAAREAGYEDVKSAAYRSVRNPAILTAIRAEQARVLYSEVGSAVVSVVLEIARDVNAKDADRLNAVRLGAEMAGFIKNTKLKDNNPLNSKAFSEMSMDELEAFVAGGAAALRAMPGKDNAPDNAPVIEGEVVEG